MSKSAQHTTWEVSAETWKAAKTALPLRLPQPEETGPHRLATNRDNVGDEAAVAFQRTALQRSLRHDSDRATTAGRPRLQRAAMNQPTDDELSSLAQHALLRSGLSGFSRLTVVVRDRVAMVSGVLPTEFELQLALQLVRRVNWLDRVEHDIEVRESGAADRDATTTAGSKQLRRRVLGALLATAVAILAGYGLWMIAA